jgi:aldehyde dehydrogenase family protein
VVGVIAPFNVPTILAIRAVAPALALGDAVVLEPDPRTAVSGGVLFARVFEEAGLPAGVFQALPGGADVGEALVTAPAVRVIAFTGSTRAGRAVGALAGRHLKRAHLELGGNSALIVLPDVDVTAAASVGAWGTFAHQGQICMATSRHLVHESIAEEYTAVLTEKVEELPVGDPFSEQVALGPLIDAGQRDRVHGLVTSSVEGGATLRTGGTFEGLFYRPTVIGDVPVEAPAYREEIFGPAAPVTPFRSLDEVAELARGTEYGLSPGILSRDVYAGPQLAERIPSGPGAHQRPDGERRGRGPVRRGRGVRHRLPPRWSAGQHRGVHRDAVGHAARRPARPSVLSAASGDVRPTGGFGDRCAPGTRAANRGTGPVERLTVAVLSSRHGQRRGVATHPGVDDPGRPAHRALTLGAPTSRDGRTGDRCRCPVVGRTGTEVSCTTWRSTWRAAGSPSGRRPRRPERLRHPRQGERQRHRTGRCSGHPAGRRVIGSSPRRHVATSARRHGDEPTR